MTLRLSGSDHGPAFDAVRRSGVFRYVADAVNDRIRLERTLRLRVSGTSSIPRYERAGRMVIVSPRFVAQTWREIRRGLAAEAADDPAAGIDPDDRATLTTLVADVVAFTLYHEVAHGIIDQLGVAISSGEEGAAEPAGVAQPARARTDAAPSVTRRGRR